jgi:endonuclease/exonuclease/phosphatase family metal-dependent hydrolase
MSNDHAGDSLTILTVNVGNTAPWCWPYVVKLCRKDVEARIARNLQALRPDLVAIQEILPPWLCKKYRLALPGSVCAESNDLPQVRRLLGPDYTIVCESRNAFECIAVRTDAGEILGCDRGALCETDRMDRQPAGSQLEGCRGSVSIMASTVRVKGRTFDVVNAHAENRSPACRLASIRQIFESGSLVREEKALIMGDFNLDPWREDDLSSRYWRQQVGADGTSDYVYHSGIAEHQPPHPTLRYPFFTKTYDHVVSNFLEGVTQVLGESPGTARLDGGRGMDHRAVYGRLSFGD